MKKKILTVIGTICAAATMLSSVAGLSACNNEVGLLDENIIDDNYDNYYEIFVYSYCDSDGDGIGDLNGVTQKLDYIRDLGYTGIWLMPIMPSASYHGYDVTDYKAVNTSFGTMEDYENLVEVAHEKDIKVIIDLVVNHTSSDHPWFQAAVKSKLNQAGGNSIYADYYNWSTTQQDKYTKCNGGNVWYESQFSSSMPDLNLSSQKVRDEIDDIIGFWLEKGTDGFRLDGCYYYCGTNEDSAEVCKFINDCAVKYNEDAYIVGECWGPSRAAIKDEYYQSGCDSFFDFSSSGEIRNSVNGSNSATLWTSMKNSLNMSDGNISAPFLSNHDNGVGRIANRMSRNEEKIKFAYGLLSMYTGNTFTYYGDEIGMTAKNASSDLDLRVGMLWDNAKTNLTTPPPYAETDYAFDGVEEQLKNPNSILNYYKLCNNARNAFPALMRGSYDRISSVVGMDVIAFKKTYKDQTITVVVNLATKENKVEGIEGTLAQSICVSGKIGYSGNTLTMPKYSIAILT